MAGVNPLSGPPAFFVTGIGAGVGISRRLLVPADFSQFPSYPFLQALDPEAEQEVDFGRYWRLLAARWWLVAAGLVVGAVIGYGLSVGGNQQFKATTTVYLEVDDVGRARSVLEALSGVSQIALELPGLSIELNGIERKAIVAALVGAGVGVETVTSRHRLEDAFIEMLEAEPA